MSRIALSELDQLTKDGLTAALVNVFEDSPGNAEQAVTELA